MKYQYNTIVLGSGVAGMTAAIYLKRSNISVLILEKDSPGGQVNRTSDIENYPGFSSIKGPDLAFNIFEQINHLEIDYKFGDVKGIDVENDIKKVITTDGEYTCKNVIIATGRKPRELGLPNEEKFSQNGISYCAVCDGPLYKGKKTAVVGGGNSAVEEAVYLDSICEKVYLIHKRDKFTADEKAQKRLFDSNVEIIYNNEVSEFLEKEHKFSGIKLKDGKEINVDGLFIYIGNKPETSFLSGTDINIENGYIIVDENMMTNIKGIYACGDVIKKDFYQISTAIGEATIASLSIKRDC